MPRAATETESRARFFRLLDGPEWARLIHASYDARLRCGHVLEFSTEVYVLLGEQIRCPLCDRPTTVVHAQGQGDLPRRKPPHSAASEEGGGG